MLGPGLFPLERSFPGRVGPTESPLSLLESDLSPFGFPPQALPIFRGPDSFSDGSSRDTYCSFELEEATAFCKVEGSYHPSASSP
jgi:hypothetical protein